MTGEQSISVALVDDHELVLDGLRHALTRHGMTVAGSFADARSALPFLACHEIDFLIVDLRLRDDSGVGLVVEARRRHPSVKIALLTGFADAEAARSAIQAGATGFLLKDTPTAELCRQLHDVAVGHLVIDSRVAAAVLHPQRVLTDQEVIVLELVAEGLTNREIGERLFLSHYTVKDYLCRTMRKLGTSTRAETVAKAVGRGLLHPAERV